jgi:hypothetical protein
LRDALAAQGGAGGHATSVNVPSRLL